MIGAGNDDFAAFQRLAQTIKHLRLKFGQFIQKQHAVMRQRGFPRSRMQAAPDQSGHGGGMMGRAKRTVRGQRAIGQQTCHRMDHRDFQ